MLRHYSIKNQNVPLYFPVGDWNQFNEEGVPTEYTHNAVHELTSVNGQPLDFDAKGNRLGSVDGAVYTWDFDNRLDSVDSVSFEYDALGRRVFENASGGSGNVLVCSGQQLLATYALDAAPSSPGRMFIYGDYIDEPILLLSGSESQLKDGEVQEFEPAGKDDVKPANQLQRHYYSRNQQFSIIAITDASGNVVERYRYDAYGNTEILSPEGNVLDQSSVGNVFMYTGRFNHPEIGLMYFRARYYDPAIGRFIGRDPLEYVDGMSLYRAYFVPRAVDPSGTCVKVGTTAGGDIIYYCDGPPPRCHVKGQTVKCPLSLLKVYDANPVIGGFGNQIIESFNCAGLATRKLNYMGLNDLKNDYLSKGQKLGSCQEKCGKCQIKFFLWEYSLHVEVNSTTPKIKTNASRDFHVVAGKVSCTDGSDMKNVFSKNGKRPIIGPDYGKNFKPAAREQRRENSATAGLLYYNDTTGTPGTIKTPHKLIGVRTNMTEACYCLDKNQTEGE